MSTDKSPAIPSIAEFKILATNFQIPTASSDDLADRRTRSYLLTYPTLLHLFEDKRLTPQKLLIGAMATYAWMARTLVVNGTVNQSVTDAFNRVSISADPGAKDLQILKDTFNNSLVGVSKMLHFAAPTRYAIWDSKVAEVLYGNGGQWSATVCCGLA